LSIPKVSILNLFILPEIYKNQYNLHSIKLYQSFSTHFRCFLIWLGTAECEKNAAVALKEAAVVMSISPIALQLRYLQTLNDIAVENNSTIILPVIMQK